MTVQAWNELAADWADHAWRAGIAVTLGALVATLVWRVTRRWASAHLGYALFLVPLVFLVVPMPAIQGLDTPSVVRVGAIDEVWPTLIGATNADDAPERRTPAPDDTAADSDVRGGPTGGLSDASTGEPASGMLVQDHIASHDSSATTASATAARGENTAAWTPAGWILMLWGTAVAAMLARFLVVQVRTHRIVRRARDLDVGSLPQGVREAVRPLVRNGTRLAESDAIHSPAAWGIMRPTLVMPTGLTRELGPSELRWVLCHELAHVGRRDVAVASLQRVIQILWFFHPVVWFVGRQVDRLRECACDEAALARCQAGSRRGFAEALVRLAERPELRTVSTLPVQALLGPKSLLETRILRMLNTQRIARSGLGWLSVPALLLVGATSILATNLAFASPAQGDRPWDKEQPKEVIDRSSTRPAPTDKQKTEKAIFEGLAYLEATQAKDGGWYASPVTEGTGLGEGTSAVESSGEFNRVGITGLAILAFLESGQGQRPVVQRAIKWLGSQQDEKGCFGGKQGFLYVPSHCMASLAWFAYFEGSKDPDAMAVAQHAVNFLEVARNPYQGWRYDAPPAGDNDTFITSLALRALIAAKAMGCEVTKEAMIGGLDWIDQMTDPKTGRCGYNKRGGPVSRIQATAKTHPVEYTEMLTAMAILARLELDQDPLESKVIRDGALLVAKTGPLWDEIRGSIDYYAWMFGTDAMQRLGGFHWNHWKKLLDGAILPNQERDGSWRAIDAWSSKGSTVHATAVCTLTLAMSLR